MSALHSGRPKAEDHRQALAAAQRRRHAATRVLRAIEEVQLLQIFTRRCCNHAKGDMTGQML